MTTRPSKAPGDRAAQIVDATPADRDRWADALRAGSLLVVVLGHWLMVGLSAEGQITNALTVVPSLQPLTWVLQVMPLFFLVGGVAHSYALDSLDRRVPPGTPGRYGAFFRGRAVRLLRPSLAFLAVWVGVGVVAHLSGLTGRPGVVGRFARDALVAVPQLLWFVGIYVGACALAPLMRAFHHHWGPYAAGLLVGSALLVDAVRFTAVEFVGNLNFALVWLAFHQLGFLWRDGRLTPRVGWLMVAGGYGSMALAITVGPYPTSMVGLPGEAVSNMAPPTAALLAQGVGICGLAVVARPLMTRVLQRRRAWLAVVRAAPFAMTAFLWHLTGLMLVLLTLWWLGVDQPPVASWAWWLTRPLLFAGLGVVTGVLVGVFLRWDRGPRTAATVPAVRNHLPDAAAALSALVIFFGILMVSIVGVDVLGNRPVFFLVANVTPVVALGVLGAGVALLLAATRQRPPRRSG
ncbi:acyltransferase [Intrasporangium calvum]|uniref:Acyltransferase n=1 Tax=Intrasporangium calvum TaxID=53358 RepID=A0ABT5GH94_9MICO|nr:acyltransferase [Intrasporangium calvum]MDC5697594.1 acyltransferase [Intrasporangium calvum]